MKAEKFLDKYLKERAPDKKISSLKNIDLISNGILDSLDIATLSVMIKKNFNINVDINSQKSIDLFRSYKNILKKLNNEK